MADERRCNQGSETTGGLRHPLLFARIRSPTELRLVRCANAHAPGAAGVSPPCVRLTHLQWRFRNCSADWRPTCWRTLLQSRSCNAWGAYAPLLFRARSPADGITTFAMHKRTRTRSGGREPAVRQADALAKALPQLFGRLSSVRWRTPLQSRPCNHGGLRPPLLFA